MDSWGNIHKICHRPAIGYVFAASRSLADAIRAYVRLSHRFYVQDVAKRTIKAYTICVAVFVVCNRTVFTMRQFIKKM